MKPIFLKCDMKRVAHGKQSGTVEFQFNQSTLTLADNWRIGDSFTFFSADPDVIAAFDLGSVIKISLSNCQDAGTTPTP